MKAKIELDIKTCNECPFYKWDEDNSCSNDSGVSYCKKAKENIQWNDKYPKIPKWCPLKGE